MAAAPTTKLASIAKSRATDAKFRAGDPRYTILAIIIPSIGQRGSAEAPLSRRLCVLDRPEYSNAKV